MLSTSPRLHTERKVNSSSAYITKNVANTSLRLPYLHQGSHLRASVTTVARNSIARAIDWDWKRMLLTPISIVGPDEGLLIVVSNKWQGAHCCLPFTADVTN